ncbi:MAG: hypothetical protein RIS94_3280 [Pseudomonadota bacterium]|jgi:hypothetical protein
MTGSPIGSIGFVALGRGWTIRYGHRQKFRVEGEFGCGFGGAVLRAFPQLTVELIADGDEAAVEQAMTPVHLMSGSIAMLFGCGIVEAPDDATVDEIVQEIGLAEVASLIGQALSAASPVKKEAVADPAKGESPRPTRPRRRTGKA